MSFDSSTRATLVSCELSLPVNGVARTLELLEGGATVPFISRYRKEATGGLDDEAISRAARRAAILTILTKQGLLTPALKAAVAAAATLTALEDHYLPYRPKQRTRAMLARERGLQPLHQVGAEPKPEEASGPAETAARVTLIGKLGALLRVAGGCTPQHPAAWGGPRAGANLAHAVGGEHGDRALRVPPGHVDRRPLVAVRDAPRAQQVLVAERERALPVRGEGDPGCWGPPGGGGWSPWCAPSGAFCGPPASALP